MSQMIQSKIGIILQARLDSRRFPKKIIQKIGDYSLIDFQLKRLSKCTSIDTIILATTCSEEDKALKHLADINSTNFFQGEANDVLKRYLDAAKEYELDNIIRITGDCPFSDPELIDEAVNIFTQGQYEYISNNKPPKFPDGLDIEIFSFNHLKLLDSKTTLMSDREHVTTLSQEITENVFNIEYSEDLSSIRWTVDESCDLEFLNLLIENIDNPVDLSWIELLEKYRNIPVKSITNSHLKRNEGSDLSQGEKLWRHAKTIIPGGNMLLSKRAEIYTQNSWPSYFSSAKGCLIYDLEGNEYLDFGLMGVGTNILGYSNEEINASVIDSINNSTMSSLNCREEVDLADKLISLNPWSGIVKFTRSGGEANTIAIRMARAHTGHDDIAICGYHGWHDWYLSANLKSCASLDTHLLKGLDPIGVPKALENTVHPFNYNDIDSLERIMNKYRLAAVKMEVERNQPPQNSFLQKVRDLCDKFNVPLIFDECTSGFRETLGGLHLKYSVNPDIAIFGKALGNGFAITAVVGKSSLMSSSTSSFISSTFWTERIGPTAALKTLEVMKRDKVYEYISDLGDYIKKGWLQVAQRNNIPIKVFGLRSMPSFELSYDSRHYFKTFITDRLLAKQIIATNSVYVSTAHTRKIADKYLEELDLIFRDISVDPNPARILALINQNPCQTTFERLN